MTQNDMILRYMREVGPITPVEALQEFGCFRLGARIYDLKRRGIPIRREMVHKVGRYGRLIQYARYSIVEGSS